MAVSSCEAINFRVLLLPGDGGFAVCCPALHGCWSQGANEAEALEMIADAMAGMLEAGALPAPDGGAAEEAEILSEADAEGVKVTVHELRLAVTA